MSPIESLIWALLIWFAPTIVAFARKSGWRWLALWANLFPIVGWPFAWFFAFHRSEYKGLPYAPRPSTRRSG